MSNLVQLSKDNDVAVITINNPPVNALSPGVPEGISEAIEQISKDSSVKAAVLIGGGRTFIAGADIREFGKITSGKSQGGIAFLPLLLRIEDSSKPVVMAIHGTAFGGGLELAMAGHYRVASPDAQVGQPEVKLGLIPGAAGTQRLPRLAGVDKALEMCAFGEPVKAPAALEAGIVDRVVEGDLLTGAIAFARESLARGETPRKPRDRNEKLAATPEMFAAAREQARKTRRGMIAPLAAIDAVEFATRLPFADGVKKEAELFHKCLFSDQSKAMIHAFFGEREVAKIPFVPRDTPVREIRKAAVIGAGTMGGGIAIVRKNYANSVKKGRFTQAVMDQRLALIRPQITYEGFEEADIIAEAV